jgi:hypothetical protein
MMLSFAHNHRALLEVNGGLTLTENRIRALLADGARLLEQGNTTEAADVFTRVLLINKDHAEAREGLARAREAAAEAERLAAARLDEAQRAVAAGREERARALIDEYLEKGGDPSEAQALLDRLDHRSGRLQDPLARVARTEAMPRPSANPRPSRSRRALVAAWAIAFAIVAAGVAGSWEGFVDRLVRPPSPTTAGVVRLPSQPPKAGDLALAEARRLLKAGDSMAALSRLDGIGPEDPAYPIARRLRAQVEAGLSWQGTQ